MTDAATAGGESAGNGSGSDGALGRRLGLLDCVILSVGGMVGSAIFVIPGSTGNLIGPTAILAWVAAGVLMSTIALCYTELSLAFPKTGGPAVYPHETLGPSPLVRAFASYIEGIGYSLGWAFGITFSALALPGYAAEIVPAAGGHSIVIALLAITLSLVINILGVDVTSRANLLLSAILLAVLVVFVGLGLARMDPANYEPFFQGGPVSFLAAVNLAIIGYGAWTVIPASAEEIRRPAWTIPRAILISLGVSTLLYSTVVVAVHGLLPASAFARSDVLTTPLGVASAAIGLPVFQEIVLPFAAIVAIFTTMLVGTMSAGRVLFALGRNGTLPSVFARVSDRFEVPWVGLVTVASVGAILALVPQYFNQLVAMAAIVGTGLPYAINILSFIGLRYYRTDIEPPFRAPGGYVLPVVAFVALAFAVGALGVSNILWSVGTLVLLTGIFAVRYLLVPDRVLGTPERA